MKRRTESRRTKGIGKAKQKKRRERKTEWIVATQKINTAAKQLLKRNKSTKQVLLSQIVKTCNERKIVVDALIDKIKEKGGTIIDDV